MDWTPSDIAHQRFRTRWRGLDPQQVEAFVQELSARIAQLENENLELKREFGRSEKALQEARERDKTIKDVLYNAHRVTEQIKANAQKEADLVLAEAELKAEKLLQSAHQRLAQMHDEIMELKRLRTQLETKLRSTIETYRQLLDMEQDEEQESDLDSKVKFLQPNFRS